MLTFLLFSVLAVVGVAVAGLFALPFLLLGGLIWLVLLPIKLLFAVVFGVFGGLFRLAFGILGAVLGLIAAPIVLVVVGVALVGVFIAAVLALLAPLVPVILLILLGWGIYRIAIRPRAAV